MTEEAFMGKEYQAFLEVIDCLQNKNNDIQLVHPALKKTMIDYFKCLPKCERGKYSPERITVNPNLQGKVHEILPV